MYEKLSPYCRDRLDPGEKCNCRYRISKYDTITLPDKTGQMVFNVTIKKEPVA